MSSSQIYAGIELGGTKTIAAIGKKDGAVIESARFATVEPEKLIEQVCSYLIGRASTLGEIAGLGVGAFGPIVLDESSPKFGVLLGTNKPGWGGFNLAAALQDRIDAPMSLVTDVAAAGIGEAKFGNLRGIDLGLYLTIGTGIGGALIHNGKPLASLLHPEMGHVPLVRQKGDLAPSLCDFHPNCAEGLAAGPAIAARFGAELSSLAPTGPEYALVADYLGQLLASLQLVASPQRVVIGGGVSQAAGLLELVRAAMKRHLASYVDCGLDDPGFIVPPRLAGEAGVVGALAAGVIAGTSNSLGGRRRA